ncbi:glycosyltransferase [Virgibacillus salexigens]|uniref:Glycosyl transferase n=1 Tax=Virgibacillus kapii TaxID=1638645 RepID=A0ABQ2DQ08_9BACI|nr:glycosyltransferase [Virgibacillus kapii]GGJ67897.1 glycosyl transferase [Virgibacillus kapii]
MTKTVCFLVSEHPFLDARIFKKEAKSLHKSGYHVTMIVPKRDGYLFDIDGTTFTDQYLEDSFYHEGIKIITYDQMYPEKHIKALHYNLKSGKYIRFTDPLTQLGIQQQADFYHAHEFFSLYCGVGIKRCLMSKGKPCNLIYDSHELEPDPLINQSSKTKKLKNEMLESMIKEIDYLITVSESIKAWHLSVNPTIPVEVIYNSPPLATDFKLSKNGKSQLILTFEGTINKKRGSFDKLVKIIEIVNQQLDVKAKIIGGFKGKEAKQQLERLPDHIQDNIQFTGWIPYEKIPQVMRDVDIGWIDLDAAHSLNNRYAMPNKFFSYLNNGIPVLVNQCEDMATFIHYYQCGYVVPKLQATARDYVEALIALSANRNELAEMKYQARNVMESTFSWEHMEKRLINVYQQLMETS